MNKKGNVLAIGIMFFLFAMISFVTGLQNPMGVIAKAQFGATNLMSQLGNAANFIAYAFMVSLQDSFSKVKDTSSQPSQLLRSDLSE